MADLQHPPSTAVVWTARYGSSSCEVEAQTWFAARALAAVRLGAPVEELTVEQKRKPRRK